jgi:hypothetical protein
VGGETAQHRRRRLRLPGDVEDQQHRETKPRGEIGGGPGSRRRSRNSIKQAQHAFNHQKFAAGFLHDERNTGLVRFALRQTTRHGCPQAVASNSNLRWLHVPATKTNL